MRMAEGTYDFEVMRAELLGIKPPNKEDFEKAREERLEIERAELEAAEANVNLFSLIDFVCKKMKFVFVIPEA